MEQNSPTNSLTTVMTFYSNLADEVDQHFTRALQTANAEVNSENGTLPHMNEYGQHMSHPSSPVSILTTRVSHYHPISPMTPATPSVLSTPISTSTLTQVHSWPRHTPQHFNQHYHASFHPYTPPPTTSNFSSNPTRIGAIIYPEFVNHLVHPEVDSFKDIPKLPGQTDPPSPPAVSVSFCTYDNNIMSCGPPPQETLQSPPSHSLLHSPLQSESQVDLSEEDLEQILELNKDTMYT